MIDVRSPYVFTGSSQVNHGGRVHTPIGHTPNATDAAPWAIGHIDALEPRDVVLRRYVARTRRLVIVLDDSRNFCVDAARRLPNPQLGRSFDRIAQAHKQIADDLAEGMRAAGAEPTRSGSLVGRLIARHAMRLVVGRSRTERDCLIQTERLEKRIVERIHLAIQRVPWLNFRFCSLLYDLELEHVLLIRQIRLAQTRTGDSSAASRDGAGPSPPVLGWPSGRL
ncbi:MAG: DUF2383 domain-containing protein [Rhodanobacteraceae bacterium]